MPRKYQACVAPVGENWFGHDNSPYRLVAPIHACRPVTSKPARLTPSPPNYLQTYPYKLELNSCPSCGYGNASVLISAYPNLLILYKSLD